MLGDAPVAATIAVSDVEAARSFYTEKLGLTISMQPTPNVFILNAGAGTSVQVYGRPDHEPAKATIATFLVSDITSVVAALEERGVAFLDYDTPHYTTGPDHVATFEGGARLAWIADPDGNIISLTEM